MILVRLKVCINRSSIIEDLNFHSHISGIACQRCPDTKSVVCTGCELKFEPENKITVFLFCIEVTSAAFIGPYNYHSVFSNVRFLVTCPVIEVSAIEKSNKSLSFLLRCKVKFLFTYFPHIDISECKIGAMCLQFHVSI